MIERQEGGETVEREAWLEGPGWCDGPWRARGGSWYNRTYGLVLQDGPARRTDTFGPAHSGRKEVLK